MNKNSRIFIDFVYLAQKSIRSHPLRTILTSLGIAIGIAAVVLLTSIGEGIHRFVLNEFSQFGTNLIAINPGKAKTHGASLGVFGTVRPMSIDDAIALKKVPYVTAVVPALQGNAEIEAGNRRRRTTVYGVNHEMPAAFQLQVAVGKFLPDDDPNNPRAFAVLGSKLKRELFSGRNPLGARIRIGGVRYRVIGSMESKGQVLGIDLDDTVYIPAARALELFNRESLMEIDIKYAQDADLKEVIAGISRIMTARHGDDDYTVTTQQQMLDVLGSILNVLTFAVGALGGISLLVGSVGILTITTISVKERTTEIGLLRAIGAQKYQILVLFLGEAIILAALGGLAGLVLGVGGAQLLHLFLPALPVYTPVMYIILAESIAILVGLLAGVIPAQSASKMDPVEALRSE
ncbi:MAG: ABC transporter permease [Gammaproteobacteria bacterium]|nr:MAG: ABC transporter permease [Gammaproteobacteria bacterium]